MDDMTASVVPVVHVRTTQPDDLASLLAGTGRDGRAHRARLDIGAGRTADGSASTALDHRILITELTPIDASLEDACLALTHAEVEYSAATTQPRRAVA